MQKIKYVDPKHTEKIIEKRNKLLRASDWTQLDDADKSKKQQYKSYRKALRDLPDQPGFPYDITWPTL